MIGRVFWYPSRKAFVPLTVAEVARRAKLSSDEALSRLASLRQTGLATVIIGSRNSGVSTWHLTSAGEAQAREIITAEAFAKGGNA